MMGLLAKVLGSSCVKQETAEGFGGVQSRLACFQDYANVNDKAGWSSKHPAGDTLYRYPSLHRSACLASRPTTIAARVRTFSRASVAAIGYHRNPAKVAVQAGADTARVQTTTIGREQCKRFRSFLRQWQYSVWRVASTMMWNAVSLAPVPVLSRPSFWAQTRQAPCLLVLQQASSATTRAFAGNLRHIAPAGAQHSMAVAGVLTPAAAFRFGDT